MWQYQKTNNDCWICALQNTLLAGGYKILTLPILEILEKNELMLFEGRAFFPYLAVILDALKIRCQFVLDENNQLLEKIIDREKRRISIDMTEYMIQESLKEKSIDYYYYLALKKILLSSYVEIKLDGPTPQEYLDRGRIVLACLPVSDLYAAELENVLHAVTIQMVDNQISIIDPYYKLGMKVEDEWEKLREASEKFDWSAKIPYFIAIDKRISISSD